MALAAIAALSAGQDIGLRASYPKTPDAAHAAIRRIRAAEQKGPLAAREVKELAMAYYSAGQHLLFRQYMDRAAQLAPADPEPWYALGRHYVSDVRDVAKAAECFRAARQRGESADLLAHSGHAEETLGRPDAAAPLYRSAVRAAPCHAVALAGLARLGQASAADLARCQSNQPVLLRELAKLLDAEGKHVEAASALERALAVEPWNASIAYQVYRSWSAAGNRSAAEKALARFREIQAVYGGQ